MAFKTDVPLPEVQPAWLRRLVTVGMLPIVLPAMIVVGAAEGVWRGLQLTWAFFSDCW